MKRILKLLPALVLLLDLDAAVEAADLDPKTLAAWDRYVAWTEHRMRSELAAGGDFLLLDGLPPTEAENAREVLRAGGVYTKKLETEAAGERAIPVPKALVHHWLGAVFIAGTSVDELLPWLQDYEAHHYYFDEVEASRLLSRDGDDFRIFMRLRRKKVVTVHYNTEHLVRYRNHGPGRVSSVSYATRIAELDDAGTVHESEKPPDDDRGFLWRLNSYWRFQDVAGGVVVELESVSLSRSVPGLLRWLVGRYLDSVPRESLEATLRPIRRQAPEARPRRPTALAPMAEYGRSHYLRPRPGGKLALIARAGVSAGGSRRPATDVTVVLRTGASPAGSRTATPSAFAYPPRGLRATRHRRSR